MAKKDKSTTGGLLRGWRQICDYTGMSRRQAIRWRDDWGMPVAKIGRTVTTSTDLIDQWLLEQAIHAREQKIKRKQAHDQGPTEAGSHGTAQKSA